MFVKKNIFMKYSKLSLEVKGTIWFSVSNFLLKVISFIVVPILTRVLSQSEYGVVTVFLSYQQFFLIIATLEIFLGAYQRGLIEFKNDELAFTKSVTLLSNLFTFCMLAIFLLYYKFISHVIKMDFKTIILMIAYFIVYPAFNQWMYRMRLSLNYKIVVALSIAFSLIISGGSLLGVYFGENSATTYLRCHFLLSILCYMPFYICVLNNKKSVLRGKMFYYWKYCLRFQLPLVPHSLSYLILGQADRVMICNYCGNEDAAIYSVGYSIANVVILLNTSINQVLQPLRYKKLGLQDYGYIRKTTNVILVVLGCSILLYVLCAPEVISIIFDSTYQSAIWIIPTVSGSAFFMMVYTVFTDIESFYYKTKYIMYASLICAALNVVLNYIGLQILDFTICGYTTLICYIIWAVLHYVFTIKTLNENGDKKEIVDSKNLLKISSVFLGVLILIILFYSRFIFRYSVLAMLCCVCYLYRKKIIIEIKRLKTYN